ncbi:MAG: alpha/beta fold hydrolase [Clostridia bacterium]|nr:alpha/beta fold hydrolase [Clostridia bacterium]
MSIQKRIMTYPSSDGSSTVHAELYLPEGRPSAIVQMAHGMMDHIGRYGELAEYFAERGVAFVGNDHLGHGATSSVEDYGFFAKEDGYGLVIEDMHKLNSLIREEFHGVPIILLGHSMGSFLSRLYAVKYPESISGLIIHGTSGKNPLLPFGRALVKILKLIRGERYRSKFVCSMADGGYNKRFDPAEGKWAWLTRDVARVDGRSEDARTNFIFTLSGYGDLFKMLTLCNKKKWYRDFPKELPTLVVSGECDPVGNFGKGVSEVYLGLKSAGAKCVSLKLYEGARHELFNEINSDEVFADLLDFVKGAAV